MNNQVDAMQAEFRKQFGIFVGFFNRANNTDMSVKDALQQPIMLELYNAIGQACNNVKTSIPPSALTSTKRKSLNKLNVCEIDTQVLNYIKANPNVSRAHIAAQLDRRISTICGAATRLLKQGLIYVSGETFDAETSRQVEALSSRMA